MTDENFHISKMAPGQGDGTGAKDQEVAPTIPDHELLRVIGRGSYGEVWLGRSRLGTLRAIKIVHLRSFEDRHPFEREFKGIQRFEPVSRSHEGLMNILQVGGGDDYFYCVMELADAAEATDEVEVDTDQSAARYVPRTLRTELKRRGRLPVEECLRLALRLTEALQHLHDHGLVHRDVKPSNIIFVNGSPKLADIGLVTDIGEARSFVGTPGFVAPEGPGAPPADLYSLGKVLYEISTGKDRREFPILPANLREYADAEALTDFNEIVLKACAEDLQQRYATAEAMRDDVRLLQAGKSVRRYHAFEQRIRLLTRAGLIGMLLLVVAGGLYWAARQQFRAVARQLYIADMNLAMQAWEGGHLRRARELLERHRADEPVLIGFEWRLLDQLCASSESERTLLGHRGRIWDLAFAPDGRTVISASGDGTAIVWDPGSGLSRHVLAGHVSAVHAVAVAPDGSLLATGGRDNRIRLWDTGSWKEAGVLAGHSDAVRALAFTPDGALLASGAEDATIRLWDLSSRREVAVLGDGLKPERLAFQPDSQVLAASGNDSHVHLWNLATGQAQGAMGAHKAHLLDLAISPDGRQMATASFDGTVRLWDSRSRDELAVLGRGAPMRRVAFSPDGRYLATASDDCLVRLWNLVTREIVTTFRGHDANVDALAFSGNGEWLATGGEDHAVRLWRVVGAALAGNAMIHGGIVNSIAFSPNGLTLASTDPEVDLIRLWDVPAQVERATLRTALRSAWCLAFAPDGGSLVTGGLDGGVRLWSLTQPGAVIELEGHRGGVDAVAVSPDGRLIASGGRDQHLRIWDGDSGLEMATFPYPNSIVRSVAFAPDGGTLAAGGTDGKVRLIELGSLREVGTLVGHQGEIRALDFAPDSRTLVSGGADRTIRRWDLTQRKTTETFMGHTAMVSSLAFSPDAKTLVSGSWDSTVKLWNLRVSREVATLRAHSGQVTGVSFAPGGDTLASSSGDGTVRLWRATPAPDSSR